MEVLTPEEGRQAVRLARCVLEKRIGKRDVDLPPLPPRFSKKRGVFVTLTERGQLRGCIGFPTPVYPLGQAICEAAYAAAVQDPRFPPVRAEELPLLRVEVTVLSVPTPLTCRPDERPEKVLVGTHGLIVRGMGRSGLLLPQVPVEWGWNAREFLDHTCQKAGLPAGCWKTGAVEVLTFEGQIFSEEESPRGRQA
ncbi:MAG: TIGR00296 family protein [Methanolinea sp.]|nr:TIGR00296 family protein [Methanolinea sp.]